MEVKDPHNTHNHSITNLGYPEVMANPSNNRMANLEPMGSHNNSSANRSNRKQYYPMQL